MNQFSEQLAQKLNNLEQAKEFATSTYTKRVHKIMPFEGAQDGDAILPLVASVTVMCVLSPVVHLVLGAAATVWFIGIVLGLSATFTAFCSGVVPYRVNKWKAKAHSLGLSTPYNPDESLEQFTCLMPSTSLLEVIKHSEEAGATPQQIQTLYQLALEDLPYVWWSDLLSSAAHHRAQNDKNKAKQSQLDAVKHAEQTAEEEIRQNAQKFVVPQSSLNNQNPVNTPRSVVI